MRVEKVYHLLLIVIATILTMSCVPQRPSTLQVGTNKWIGYEPLYVAQERGFYKNQNIKIIELSSASQVAKAFEQGIIEVAALTLDETIKLASRSNEYSVLWVLDYSSGGDALLAQADIAQFEQLSDKRVGVEEGSVGRYLLSRAAEINGVDLDVFEIVPLHNNQQAGAFLAKSVDAVVTFDPVRTYLLDAGANELFSSRDIPGEIVDVLVTKKHTELKAIKQIKALLWGWQKAVTLIEKDDEAAFQLLAKRSNVPAAEVHIMLDNIHIPNQEEVFDMLYQKEPKIEQAIKQLSEFLYNQGQLRIQAERFQLLPNFDFTE